MSLLPYRWKSVKVIFGDVKLKTVSLRAGDREKLLSYKFDGKAVIGVGLCSEFGRKKADALAFNLKDEATGVITCEPVEQVFYTEHVRGKDKDALLMRWLVQQFGDVTLSEDTGELAAAESEQEIESVTIDKCLVCGHELHKRSNAKTCSPKCRKAYSRRQMARTK